MWIKIAEFLKRASRSRLVWLTLILAASAVTVFILNYPKEEGKRELPLAQRQKHPLLEDKDNDGLQAWEEELYKTNPENPDTDGDGTPDGEEIKSGRNPLVKGPNDTITNIKPPEEEKNKSETEPVNLTQELFNELVKKGGVSAITKKGSAPLISSIITQKVDELASSGKLTPSSYLGFTPPQIKTSEDKSPEAIKIYLNQVADIFEKHIAPLQKDDLDLFLEILQSGNLERLSELSPYREAVLATSAKIQELTVPKILAWFHQRQIFYLEESARQLFALERAEVDPVTALVVSPQRLDLKVEVIKLYHGELKLWLGSQKIEITPKEKAYYLMN